MSVATDSMGMRMAGPSTEMRQVGERKLHGVRSLVISPNLDALLEHDERTRRAAHSVGAGSWSSGGSFGELPGVAGAGLPPPPRRTRTPGSPMSPPPRSPLITQQSERASTSSSESNPYINPAPLFDDERAVPITPPPRTSPIKELDSRFQLSPSLPARFKPKRKTTSPETPLTTRRSRGKLVKPRDSSSPHSPSNSPTSSSPQMSEIRRQRSRRRSSISVSSAISTDRESFIDLNFSPANQQDFDVPPSPFRAASPSPSDLPRVKPPIPTTPKPDFSRAHARRASPAAGPPPALPVRAIPPDTMPPTTNFLNPSERAQLIKKSRKLAQVFGETPGAADFLPDARSTFLDVHASGSSKPRHRAAASMNMVGQMPPVQRPLPPWPAPEKTIHMDIHGRRHSNPTTPISDEGPADSVIDTEIASDAPPSPRSFMDFSISNEDADLGPDDSVSVVDTRTHTLSAPSARSGLPASPSSPSLFENLSPEEQAEEERRKKRDKLAKLHRFLGSRVPANLVLGPDYLEASLPPPVVALDGTLAPAGDPDAAAVARSRTWVKRRRSSSAVITSAWSDDLDRLKEDLNDREKAIIVRRAQKMEKKLYHASGSGLGSASGARTVPASPGGTPPSTPPTQSRNPNQTPYRRRSARKSSRPGTGDSGQFLLADAEPSAGSFVYTHYQHSLNSLHDILDRNDKESLAELHQYLNDASADEPPLSPSRPTLTKAERRRSLPARTSMASLTSIASASSLASLASVATTTSTSTHATTTTPEAERSEFQQRRRRAAKLTQFFGVDYRDLIEDVLDSIEHGLDAERSRGTLNPAEAEDLLQKLRTLKTRRT
ncbi:hypothetical protein FB451DRAFT_1388613 [Mycena latifolia]|nr:hypothetical protein FB451DRAFT_1388613 [Mycena latifolia]